jgi:hypothetical protein
MEGTTGPTKVVPSCSISQRLTVPQMTLHFGPNVTLSWANDPTAEMKSANWEAIANWEGIANWEAIANWEGIANFHAYPGPGKRGHSRRANRSVSADGTKTGRFAQPASNRSRIRPGSIGWWRGNIALDHRGVGWPGCFRQSVRGRGTGRVTNPAHTNTGDAPSPKRDT